MTKEKISGGVGCGQGGLCLGGGREDINARDNMGNFYDVCFPYLFSYFHCCENKSPTKLRLYYVKGDLT